MALAEVVSRGGIVMDASVSRATTDTAESSVVVVLLQMALAEDASGGIVMDAFVSRATEESSWTSN